MVMTTPTCPVTIYFDASGNDTSGDGSAALPFRTIQFAMDWTARNINACCLAKAPDQITVKSLTPNAVYTENAIAQPTVMGILFPNMEQSGFIKLDLNGSTVDGGGNHCFSAAHASHTAWYYTNLKTIGSAFSFVADSKTRFYLGNVTLGTTGGDVSAAYGGQVEFEEDWQSAGAKTIMFDCHGAGSQVIMRSGHTIVGQSASYSGDAMMAYDTGVISISGISWGGSLSFARLNGANRVGFVATSGGIEGSNSITSGIGIITVSAPGWTN